MWTLNGLQFSQFYLIIRKESYSAVSFALRPNKKLVSRPKCSIVKTHTPQFIAMAKPIHHNRYHDTESNLPCS